MNFKLFTNPEPFSWVFDHIWGQRKQQTSSVSRKGKKKAHIPSVMSGGREKRLLSERVYLLLPKPGNFREMQVEMNNHL